MTSIRRLMLVALIGAASVVMTVAAAFSYHAGLQEAGEMFDAKLAHSSRVLMSLVDDSLGDLQGRAADDPLVVRVWHGEAHGVGAALAFPTGHAYETKLAFQARSAEGVILLRSDSGPVTGLAPLAPGFADRTIDGEQWRVFTLRSPAGLWYQSGERSDIREELAQEIAFGTLLPLVLALPLLALLVWAIVTWATRGLLRVSREIEDRAADRLAPIQLARVPREIGGLVNAVNGLMRRLQDTLQRERRFTADAAHELRTPIAALKVHADNLRAARDDAERASSQALVEAGVQRIERQLAQLLTLSRVEHGATVQAHTRVDLGVLAARQTEELSALAARRAIDLRFEGEAEGVVVDGDEAALDALVRNLADNALRYTPRGGRIVMRVAREEGHARLDVEDSGPGIPEEARERVFDRFHRELGSGVEGSGLGLSIVRQVVASHGGRIDLGTSSALGGLRATVLFPHADGMHRSARRSMTPSAQRD